MVYPCLGVAVVATELEELRKYTEEFSRIVRSLPSIPKKIRSDLILLMTMDEKTYNRRNLTNHPLPGVYRATNVASSSSHLSGRDSCSGIGEPLASRSCRSGLHIETKLDEHRCL
jgi:hypothetical protein